MSIKFVLNKFSATTPSPYFNMGGYLPKSKLIETIKGTYGYDNGMGYGRDQDSWPNDNPFTTTSTLAPRPDDKVTQTQTAMLEVFQWLYSSTLKPIVSTMVPTSTSGSYITNRDEWGNSVETYRVDEPPHSSGLSEYRFQSTRFSSSPMHFLFAVAWSRWFFVSLIVHYDHLFR